jgi:hypothetical protein
LIDGVCECVGIKTGLALRADQLVEILEARFPDIEKEVLVIGGASRWWIGDPNGDVGLRGEEFEAACLYAMHSLGAIKRPWQPGRVIAHYTAKTHNPSKDISNNMYIYTLTQKIYRDLLDGKDAGVPADVVEEFRKSNVNDTYPVSRDWNGIIKLDDLFKSEAIPENTIKGQYFDQRYIDYLALHENLLEEMHWRQFEYLTGEYFRRNGYEVEITPPRGDGGVDVIARRADPIAGPELVIVQCKRHSGANTVSIESVKAFYTDVQERDATRGLIVTTTDFEPGARKFCEAKQYRLTAADRATEAKWIKELSRAK